MRAASGRGPIGLRTDKGWLSMSLYGFAVDRHIEALALDLVADPQAEDLVQSVEDGQRDSGEIRNDDDDARKLVQYLQRVSLDQARRVPILADCEHAGEKRARRAGDGMNAECVQRVVVAKARFDLGDCDIAEHAGGDPD